MEMKKLANEIIRYGECVFDKRTGNTRIQHFLYNNHGYEIIRQDGKFLVIELTNDCVKKQKQLKLIQKYLLKEVAPKILDELYTLNMDNGVYDFAEMVDYVIRNKVAEDTTYQLLDNLQ